MTDLESLGGSTGGAEVRDWLRDSHREAFAPSNDRSIWVQIYDRLRGDIEDGRIAAGSRLPGENQLAEVFGVTRVTLRRALQRLQREGFLESRKGVGVFARKALTSYTIASGQRFVDALDGGGGPVTTRTLCLERGMPSEAAARALVLPPGGETISLSRVRLLDDQPVYITSKVFPASLFPRFEEVYARSQSVTEVFRAHGIARYSRMETRVSGGFATTEQAAALRLSPETPLMVTKAINGDSRGRRIEFNMGYWPLMMVELVFRPDDPHSVFDAQEDD